jgi:hypothetical protein
VENTVADNTDLNPNGPAQGTSYIYKYGTSPNTRAVVSQKIRVLAPAWGGGQQLHQIGVLGTLSPSDSRASEPVRGIGFGDVIAEIVPGNTEPMKVNTERTLLYLSNLWQSTGYAGGVSGPVRSLRHHRWPFDVLQQIVFSTIADQEVGASPTTQSLGFSGSWGPSGPTSAIGAHRILVTMYEACWWESWSASIGKDAALISESGDFSATDVHDFSSVYGEFMQTGNDPSIGQYGSMQYGNTFGGGIIPPNILEAVGVSNAGLPG